VSLEMIGRLAWAWNKRRSLSMAAREVRAKLWESETPCPGLKDGGPCWQRGELSWCETCGKINAASLEYRQKSRKSGAALAALRRAIRELESNLGDPTPSDIPTGEAGI
jgi:hypothetical protein